ncbi:MAG: preprotein translocase subunit YajC [Clostridia bacterium]
MALFVVVLGMMGWTMYQNSQQQKRRKSLQDNLKRGDRVVTVGGMVGRVSRVSEDRIWVQVSDNVEIEMVRAGIGSRIEG